MKRIGLVLAVLLVAGAMVFGGGSSQPATPTLPSTTTVTVEMFDRGSDGGRSLAHDNAWTRWIQEKVKKDIGIDVTFQPVGRWTEQDDIVNLMASGSAPDLCYSYNTGMIGTFRDLGGVMDLAPYIDKYLPDLKKLLGDDPAYPGKDFIYRDQIQQNQGSLKAGQIFSIPNMRVSLAQRALFIRKDWLDKLGIAVPTNLNQYYAALTAFRARATELPGNLTQARVVPLGINEDTRWGLADFMDDSIRTNLSDRERWINVVAERNHALPGYKEGVRLMNKWYNERLLYQDFPLMTVTDDFYNQIKSGVVGSFLQNWDLPYRTDYNINAELARNVPNASFIPIDIGLRNRQTFDKPGLRMYIPSFSKNQEAALKYLNWLSKYENYHYLQVGEAGRNHTLVNGVPRTDPRPAGDPWFMNSSNNVDITMPLNGVLMETMEQSIRVLALSYGTTPADTIVNAYNTSIKNARAPVVTQYTPQVNQYTNTLADKSKAMLAQSIRAPTAQFDSVYDAAYRDWLASGAQEVINERSTLWPANRR